MHCQPGSEPDAEAMAAVAELARQQGVEPIRSADELVQPGMFDSDQELEEFLDELRTSRRRGT